LAFAVWAESSRFYKPEFWDKVQELDQWTNKYDPMMRCQPMGLPRKDGVGLSRLSAVSATLCRLSCPLSSSTLWCPRASALRRMPPQIYLLLFAASVHAGVIQGVALEHISSRPLAGTVVRLEPVPGSIGTRALQVRANRAGHFVFAGVNSGLYFLFAQRD